MTEELLLVGRVARAHGNKGHVIVNLETDFPEERFQAGQILMVGPEERAEAKRIRQVRFHNGRPVIALEGVETMDDAEALAGADLRMSTAAMGPLPANTFYRHDLVGCEVRDGRERVIGEVTDVEGTLGQNRLVVQGRHGEVLIPMVAAICLEVDVAAKRIVVNPPEGLLDLNERPS